MNPYAITALPDSVFQSGPATESRWHCLLVHPGKERAVRGHLRAADVFAFYPSREMRRTTRRGVLRRWEKPEVTGYVFAKFTQADVRWHVLKERRRLITGVLGVNGVPVEINRDVIRHLQGLTLEAAKLEEARKEMFRVRPGDKATFAAGPLQGFVVEVTDVLGDMAMFAGVFGIRSKADLSSLVRIMPEEAA